MKNNVIIKVTLLVLAVAGKGLSSDYQFHDLGTLGGPNSFARAVNEDGMVVGSSDTGASGPVHAFVWSNCLMDDLGTLGGATESGAEDVNALGNVAGWSPGSSAALRWADTDDWISLEPVGGIGKSVGKAINESNCVVGFAQFTSIHQAFVWCDSNGNGQTDSGEMLDIGAGDFSTANDINNNGIVVGFGNQGGFIYEHPVGPVTPVGTGAFDGINEDGRIVGWRNFGGDGVHAAVYWGYTQGVLDDGTWTDLGTFGGVNSKAYDINDDGIIVGWAESGATGTRAFRYENGGMLDLHTGYFPSDWVSSEAWAINNSGWIVGSGDILNEDGSTNTHGFLLVPIVEAPAEPPVESHAQNAKNRYLSFVPSESDNETALLVTLVESTQFPEAVGSTWWVGTPQEYCQNGGQITPPCTAVPDVPDTFLSSSLQCEQHCMDWGSLGDTMHVGDLNIVPGAVYEVRAVDCRCDATNPNNFSQPLAVSTSQWGDTIDTCEDCPCAPPEGSVNIVDCKAVLDRFVNAACAPLKVRVDLEPAKPDRQINITDAVACIQGFQGLEYDLSEPVGCSLIR